jgi:hypothetical protein
MGGGHLGRHPASLNARPADQGLWQAETESPLSMSGVSVR